MLFKKIDIGTLAPSINSEFIYFLANIKEQTQFYFSSVNATIGLGIILAGHSQIRINNNWLEVPRFSIFGMADRPVEFRMSPSYKEVSIGFKAYNFSLYTKENLSQFSKGKITDAKRIFNERDLNNLYSDLKQTINIEDSVKAIEQFFKKQIRYKNTDLISHHAYQLIFDNQLFKVEDLAKNLSVSTTTIRNHFIKHIGLRPKELVRIFRISSILNQTNTDFESLTALSYDMGYFDQAHFIKDFRKVMNINPKSYFNNKNLAFDFYNYNRWRSINFDD